MEVLEYISWDVTLSGEIKRDIPTDGVIGIQLFDKKIALIDFKNHHVMFLNEAPQLQDSSVWIPYDKNFAFNVLIDGRKVKAVIDSGASSLRKFKCTSVIQASFMVAY